MSMRDLKIEALVQEEVKWGLENMRDTNEERVKEDLQELSDEELDFSLGMRCIQISREEPA